MDETIMYQDNYLSKLHEALEKKASPKVNIDECLHYATRLVNNGLPVIFDIKHFSLLLGANFYALLGVIFTSDKNYQIKSIPKKSGEKRELTIPSINLKFIQQWILNNILNNIKVSNYAIGFHKDRSILENAKFHLNQECVVNVDLKDFFPSINTERIFRIFYYYGYTRELSFFLSKICCYNNGLPQGAPTSPYLSNIACLKLDKRLSKLAEKYNANYSRYADDITFSGSKGLGEILPILETIIKDEGFLINDKKTRIQRNFQKQMVTGIVVNDSTPKVPKKFKKLLSQEIYFCKKFGVSNHQERISDHHSFYKEHLYGKAYFIKMIEPDIGKKFLKKLDEIDWDY